MQQRQMNNALQRQQGGERGAASDAAERLNVAVLSNRLWCSDCQQLQQPLPTHVPTTFASPQEYLSVFTPLLLEEAAEGVRSSFEDAESNGKGAAVIITDCQEQPEGWRRLTVKPSSPQAKQQLLQLQRDRDAAVVVLTLQPQQQQEGGTGPVRVTGLVSRVEQEVDQGALRVTGLVSHWDLMGRQDIILVRVRPWCGNHEWGSGPCCQIYNALKRSIQQGATWQLTPAGSTVTALREVNTLNRLQDIQLLPYLLNPANAHAAAAAAAGSAQAGEPALPEEVADGQFKLHLTTKFDQPQVDAILKCAAHVQPSGSSDGSSGGSSGGWAPPVCLIQGPPGTGKTYTVLGVLNLWHMVLYHRHYSSLDTVVQRLVQNSGPGTRIDKVLLSEGFRSQLAPRPRILVCAPSNAATDELLERVMRGGFIDKNGNKYNPNMIRLGSEEALSSAAQEVWVEQLAGRLLAMDPQTFRQEHQAFQQERLNLTTALANLAESVAAMRTLVSESQADAAADPENKHLVAAAGKQLENMQQVVARLVGNFERLRVVNVELARRQILSNLVAGKRSDYWSKRMQKLRAGLVSQQQQQQQQPQRDEWRQAFRMCPRDLQQQLEASFIADAEMVFTTLSSSGREVFNRLAVPFPLVLLDEAGQATEVASLQPLVYGARGVVMVGDPQQLPATIFSQAGKQLALERSLFERLAAGGCPVSMLKVQYRMHPAIRTFPSAFFYDNELIDAESVLLRQEPWYLQDAAPPPPPPPPPPASTAHNPADPRKRRSPTPDAAVAALLTPQAPHTQAAAAQSQHGSSGGSSGSGSSRSFLLPYGVFDVAGVEHSVGRSKANMAEAQLAVELYCQLRPALLVRCAAAQAEAAARQELLLALPTDVGIVTPYRGQRDTIRDMLVSRFGPDELSRVRVETIDSFQGKQLDVVILSLTRASGGNRGQNAPVPPPATAAAAAAAAAAGGSGGDGRQMLQLNRAGVGFLSDVRRMNVAITRARLACLILGRVATLQQDAAWAALVADAAARGCLFKVPSVGALTQPQQQQLLMPLIQAARQQQDELMLQLRKQRNLTLPPPDQQQQQQQQGLPLPPVVLQQQHPVQYNHRQQLLQQGGQLGLPPLQQQHQPQQQQQPPGVRLPTPPPGLQQQGAGTAEGDRPIKQQKLEQPAPLSAAAAAMQVNSAAVAAVASAAEEARRGSRQVYSGMGPEQAVVAWGLWPRVVELQQRVLMQQGSAAAETQAQP